MSNRTRTKLFSIVAGALTVLGLVADAKPAAAGESCHRIDATAEGQHDFAASTTDAKVRGGGLLQGTTHGLIAPDFSTFDGRHLEFDGLITFTTNKATLSVVVEGVLDLATNTFTAHSVSMSGTGKLAGASGTISLAGAEDETGHFTESIVGEICDDLNH